jgi:hypothetical protein
VRVKKPLSIDTVQVTMIDSKGTGYCSLARTRSRFCEIRISSSFYISRGHDYKRGTNIRYTRACKLYVCVLSCWRLVTAVWKKSKFWRLYCILVPVVLHFAHKMNACHSCPCVCSIPQTRFSIEICSVGRGGEWLTKNLFVSFSFILLRSSSLQQRFPKWMLRPFPNRP